MWLTQFGEYGIFERCVTAAWQNCRVGENSQSVGTRYNGLNNLPRCTGNSHQLKVTSIQDHHVGNRQLVQSLGNLYKEMSNGFPTCNPGPSLQVGSFAQMFIDGVDTSVDVSVIRTALS